MIAKYAVLTALSMILSYVESVIPVPVPIPGIKLGLANVSTMICFYLSDNKAGAWAVAAVRIILSALLFGNLYSFVFSMAGGICSLLFMTLALKTDMFSVTGVSMIGGVMHNVGQAAAAAMVLKAAMVMTFIPFLIIGGIISGILIGLLSAITVKRIKKAGVKL